MSYVVSPNNDSGLGFSISKCGFGGVCSVFFSHFCFQLWVSDFRFGISNFRFGWPGIGLQILGFRHSALGFDSRSWIVDIRWGIWELRCWISDIPCSNVGFDLGFPMSGARFPVSEFRLGMFALRLPTPSLGFPNQMFYVSDDRCSTFGVGLSIWGCSTSDI